MADLGGLRFSRIAVLASGFSRDDWPAQFGAIRGTKSLEAWGRDKGVLWFYLASRAFSKTLADLLRQQV